MANFVLQNVSKGIIWKHDFWRNNNASLNGIIMITKYILDGRRLPRLEERSQTLFYYDIFSDFIVQPRWQVHTAGE